MDFGGLGLGSHLATVTNLAGNVQTRNPPAADWELSSTLASGEVWTIHVQKRRRRSENRSREALPKMPSRLTAVLRNYKNQSQTNFPHTDN